MTCQCRTTQALCFNIDKFSLLIKIEEPIVHELQKSLKHKVPKSQDTVPRFDDVYKKVFMTTKVESLMQSPTNSVLPPHELRAVILKGKELDRRAELDEIINDFPKINN